MSIGKISSAATSLQSTIYGCKERQGLKMAMSSQKMDFHNKNPHLHKIQRENA